MTTTEIDSRQHLQATLAGLHQLLQRVEALDAEEQRILDTKSRRYKRFSDERRWGGRRRALLLWWLSCIALGTVGESIGAIFLGPLLPLAQQAFTAAAVIALIAIVIAWPRVRAWLVARRNARVAAYNEKTRKEIAIELAPQLVPVHEQKTALATEYLAHYDGFFPQRYLTVDAVEECWQLVADHRADSVKEAINLYEAMQHQRETAMHQQRLENLAQNQLAEQQQATRAIRFGTFVNAVGHVATKQAVVSEGAATRSAIMSEAASTRSTIASAAAATRSTVQGATSALIKAPQSGRR